MRRRAVLLLLLPLSISLCAQSKSMVQCDALVGWNGVAREGRFAPLLVSVENAGASVDTEVRVDVEWGAGPRSTPYHRVFHRAALLAAGATRRIPFVIPVRRDVRALRVQVLSGGLEMARTEADLRSLGAPDRLVAALASQLSFDALAGLSDTGGSATPGARGSAAPAAPTAASTVATRVVYPRVDDLPEAWAAYDAISMLVVHDTAFQQLREAQVAAIESWVVTGGVLVFTGGADALSHADAGFQRLLPVRVSGIREAGLTGLAPFLGGMAPPRGRTTVAVSTLVAGTALASQDGFPLIVQHRFGRGSIWFAAFDPTLPPFDTWTGTLAFWRRVSEGDLPAVLDTTFLDPVDDPWVATVLAAPPYAFPSIIAALVFFAGYFLLLFFLLAGRLSRRMGARARALALVAVSAVAGVAGWLVFNRVLMAPQPDLLEAGRVEVVSGEGLGIVSDHLGLFATRAARCSLSVGTSDVSVDEISANSAAPRGDLAGPAPLDIDLDRRVVLRDVSLGRFGSRLFALRSVIPFDVSATLGGADSALRVVVVNGASRALSGCFLVRGGRGYAIGDIAAGARATKDVGSSAGVDLRAHGAAAQLCADPRRAAFLGRAGLETGADMVVGWLDGPILSVEAQGAQRPADRPSLSLVTVKAQ